MSDYTDAIYLAVGEEWDTTRRIAERVTPSRGQGDYDHMRSVYKCLDHMARQGFVEKRVEGSGGSRQGWWRRPSDRHRHVWLEHESMVCAAYTRFCDECRICHVVRATIVWNDGDKEYVWYGGEADA